MLGASIPAAFLLTDRWGRRTSALGGGLGLAGLMFLIGGLSSSVVGDAGAGAGAGAAFSRWAVVVPAFLFCMLFCATWGVVAKVYAAEILPGNTRAAANSVAMGLNFVSSSSIPCLFPRCFSFYSRCNYHILLT